MNHFRDIAVSPADVAAFWRQVVVGSQGECWPWIGYQTQVGHGLMRIDGVVYYARRISMFLRLKGELDKESLVRHIPLKAVPRRVVTNCVNPSHLFVAKHPNGAAAEPDALGLGTAPDMSLGYDDALPRGMIMVWHS